MGRKTTTTKKVALRKESVDRNLGLREIMHKKQVALRKESVDRNYSLAHRVEPAAQSLSARRAWIEIHDFRICV